MTTSSNDRRFDQITALVEANRIDISELRTLIESNAKAIAANSTAIAETREGLENTRASVDGLVQTIAQFSARSEARLNRLDDAVVGIERILEQLMRSGRNGNGDQPQP